MTTHQMKSQPYGVGRFSGGVIAVIIALLALTGIGLFGYSQQLVHGDYVTGLRNIGTMGGVTWGLYVVIYVYFMGLSFAGITLSILTRLFNWKSLYPITRMAQVMTIIALLMGAFGVVADGDGFNLEQAKASGRLGLYGMQERTELLGGQFVIEAEPDKGTSIFIEVLV